MSVRNTIRVAPGAITFLMLALTAAYYPWRHYGSWPAYVIVCGFFCLIVLHVALVVIERERMGFLIYGITNAALYLILGEACLYLVTGDSL
ncbi:MAG TPA: hypothetical protein VLV50_10020 [Stellaceae bacterium]|nr:hypothetical protein [Stellaceae bacterium]